MVSASLVVVIAAVFANQAACLTVVFVKNIHPNLYNATNGTGYYPSLMSLIGNRLPELQNFTLKPAESLEEAVQLVASNTNYILAGPLETDGKYDSRLLFTEPVYGNDVVLVHHKKREAAHLTVLGPANVDATLQGANIPFSKKIIDRLMQADKNRTSDGIYFQGVPTIEAALTKVETTAATTFLTRKAAMLLYGIPSNTSARWPNLVIDPEPLGTFHSVLGLNLLNDTLKAKLDSIIMESKNNGCLKQVFWRWFPKADFIRPAQRTLLLGQKNAQYNLEDKGIRETNTQSDNNVPFFNMIKDKVHGMAMSKCKFV